MDPKAVTDSIAQLNGKIEGLKSDLAAKILAFEKKLDDTQKILTGLGDLGQTLKNLPEALHQIKETRDKVINMEAKVAENGTRLYQMEQNFKDLPRQIKELSDSVTSYFKEQDRKMADTIDKILKEKMAALQRELTTAVKDAVKK